MKLVYIDTRSIANTTYPNIMTSLSENDVTDKSEKMYTGENDVIFLNYDVCKRSISFQGKS